TAVLLAMLFLPALTHITPSIAVPEALVPLFAIDDPLRATQGQSKPSAAAEDASSRSDRAADAYDSTSHVATRTTPGEPVDASVTSEHRNATRFHSLTRRGPFGDTPRLLEQEASATTPARPGATAPWAKWLFAGYAVGVTLLLIRFCLAVWSVHRIIKRARRIDPHGASRAVVLECRGVRVPLTLGVFRPCIVLPTDRSSWNDDMLAAVLAHEQAHIDRKDTLVMAIAELNRCLYWFHPLAWHLRSRLAMLAEHICDDQVVSVTGDRGRYAQHLLRVASRRLRSNRPNNRSCQPISMAT
ncbi:MAG: M56 family metallopeptidase, partial [Pirellulaceae bacterium]